MSDTYYLYILENSNKKGNATEFDISEFKILKREGRRRKIRAEKC